MQFLKTHVHFSIHVGHKCALRGWMWCSIVDGFEVQVYKSILVNIMLLFNLKILQLGIILGIQGFHSIHTSWQNKYGVNRCFKQPLVTGLSSAGLSLLILVACNFGNLGLRTLLLHLFTTLCISAAANCESFKRVGVQSSQSNNHTLNIIQERGITTC